MTTRPRVARDGDAGRRDAAEVLRGGGLVALPTDTVYGIACDLSTPDGIERLFRAKGRPPDRAIMLLLADPAQAWLLGVETRAAALLAEMFWPGGMTLVLARRPDVTLPAAMTAGVPTVGLRVPDHECPRAIAAAIGPFPATSANRSGEPEARDAAAIVDALGGAIDLVVDGGPATGGAPSTVVDCSEPLARILRPGAVDPARIATALENARIAHAIAPSGDGGPPRPQGIVGR
jgi:L-threonylcarbamoyladenylate synthase